MEVILDPLIDYVIEIVAALVGILASWALKRAADWMGVPRESEMYAWVQDQVERALDDVERRVKKRATGTEVTLENADIAKAAQIAISNSPKYLDRLGLGEEDVKRMIRERL